MGFHRRLAPSVLNRGAGAALCALSAAAAALGAVPANAASSGHTRAEVDRLYRQAEEVTEAYNKAGERAAALRHEVNGAQDRIARTFVGQRRAQVGFDRLVGIGHRSQVGFGVDAQIKCPEPVEGDRVGPLGKLQCHREVCLYIVGAHASSPTMAACGNSRCCC